MVPCISVNYILTSFFFGSPQDLLTRHKVLVAEYLEQNYDAVRLTHSLTQSPTNSLTH